MRVVWETEQGHSPIELDLEPYQLLSACFRVLKGDLIVSCAALRRERPCATSRQCLFLAGEEGCVADVTRWDAQYHHAGMRARMETGQLERSAFDS